MRNIKMKKLISLLLLCMVFGGSVQAAIEKTVTMTVTVGVSFTLDPGADLGYDSNYYRQEAYVLSDPSAFTISSATYKASYYGGSNDYLSYRYTLTPTKTGTYTFTEKYIGNKIYSGVEGIMTYSINVVDITAINLGTNSMSLFLGGEYSFTPIITHPQAVTTLTWQSSNTSVATIDSNGRLTTTGIGTTTITCTAHNGVSAQCKVTVNPVLVSSITLNETSAEMVVGEKLNLTATIAPDNATDKSVTWSSTNETVAVVDESGQVTAVGSGTCQVKVTANDGSGKTASCLVTVEKNNKLTVTDMTQCSGGQGVLNVLLSDEETIMGFQFDLQLPTGVTVAEKDGKLLAQLTGNAVNTHSIASSKISEGLYRFIVTPQGSRAISNANGDGMTINIDVADDVPTGTYDMTIKDIEMTVKHTGNVFEDIHPKDSKATLTVTEAVMGDVNGDGRVSVTDVISMNSYILEEEPAQFIRKVADMNGDGKVTITDMVQVIDIILGR